MEPIKDINPKNIEAQTSLLRRWYGARRATLPPMGSRSWSSMGVASVLALALMSTLLSLAMVQRGEDAYLRHSAGVQILDDIAWQFSAAGQADETHSLPELANIDVAPLVGTRYTLQANIPAATMQEFAKAAGNTTLVLALPAFYFNTATLSTSWAGTRQLTRGEPVVVYFPPRDAMEGTQDYHLSLTVSPHVDQKRILSLSTQQTQVPMFLAVQARYQNYLDFAAGRRTGSGKQLADIGRIVLAVFSVLLFLFIDSSPECLGLGIFMSLKAFGVVLSQGWISDSMISAEHSTYLRTGMLGFADVMQLYFFTQLARLFKPRPMTWLAVGLVFGFVYSLGANIPTTPGGTNWSFEVWRWRNIILGLGCLACSLPVAVICWRDKLYHRTAALLVASSGVTVQILSPILVGFPDIADSLWFKTWYNLFEAHTPYVFALSTFINVSTLERRVKTLSRAAIHAEAIERELFLGKAVQDAFFKAVPMPEEVGFAFSHEAAVYVSGDIIYSHYDPERHTVTVVLCDVTGHGVQAALKASICSAMCESLWNAGKMRADDSHAQRLSIFYQRVTAYLSKISRDTEILAMIGCELNLKTLEASLFRANAWFPMIAQQRQGRWAIELAATGQGVLDQIHLRGQTFIILVSDGLIDGSRTCREFVSWLGAAMSESPYLSAEQLKSLVMSYGRFPTTHDDRTLCILELKASASQSQYRPEARQLPA